ncbi:putative nuclear transcription factor, X-box binding protein, partial [Operophtera brumata]
MKTDNLPQWFCFECAALLHKYHKFKEKCSYGQNTLKNLFYNSLNKDFINNENTTSNKKDILISAEVNNQLLNIEDSSKDSLLFSLLTSKPKRSKKKSEVKTEPTSKPRKFERKKRARINKDNWEIKILSEDEALEQFKQRINNSKYIKFNFKCNKCLKGFSRNDILLRHNKQCHDEGKFECRFCHMLFKRKFQLGRHMVVHYYVYQSTASFHEDSHNGVIRTCKHCGEQFKHVSTYYTHLRMSHRNSHICKLCGASFVSETGLEFHMKRQHCISEEITVSDITYIHICKLCGASFVSETGLEFHMKRQHCISEEITVSDITYIHICKLCGASFVSETGLEFHMKRQHCISEEITVSDITYIHICKLCGASFVSETGLEFHMKRQHCISEEITEVQNANIYCERCDVSFVSQSAFDEHLAQSKLHEDEQPSRKKRSRKEIIENATTCRFVKCRKHVATEHRGAKLGDLHKQEQERVMCEICGAWLAVSVYLLSTSILYKFTTRAECRKHVATEHRGAKLGDLHKQEQERVMCEICGAWLAVSVYLLSTSILYKFTTRAECRKHVATEHRGAKLGDLHKQEQERVMCEICGAWLAVSVYLLSTSIYYISSQRAQSVGSTSRPSIEAPSSETIPYLQPCTNKQTYASSIEVHMNRHTKKKKHTGIRPHACKICHKRFSQKFAMEIHYRRVHLKEPYPK